jgi:hypothetical protein
MGVTCSNMFLGDRWAEPAKNGPAYARSIGQEKPWFLYTSCYGAVGGSYAPLQGGARIAPPAGAPSWAGPVEPYFLYLFFFFSFQKFEQF